MAEFCNSEHTGAFETAKLARNKCPFVENRVQEAEKWQKYELGPSSHVADESAPHGSQRHMAHCEWSVNGCVSADWRLPVAEAGRVGEARGSACGDV